MTGLTFEQLEAMATCDWGYCDEPAITYRMSEQFGGYLPVCKQHSEMGEEIARLRARIEALHEVMERWQEFSLDLNTRDALRMALDEDYARAARATTEKWANDQ
jgi:hypothetical protein